MGDRRAPRLAGIGVAVTRAEDETGSLTLLLERERARVVRWPCVSFGPPEDPGPLKVALADLDAFDWIVVTSPRAANVLVRDAGRPPARARVAAAGPSTAGRLREAGWAVHLVPEPPGGGPLVDDLAATGEARGARIFFPCSDRALPATADGLTRLGATVERVVAYRTLRGSPDPAEVMADVAAGGIQVVTFASPSAVDGLCHRLTLDETDGVLGRIPSAAIGDTTASALRKYGYPPAAVAQPSTLAGLVEATVVAASSVGVARPEPAK
ncbi:MAG: uroporphyrinogen-III synthase [Gemmatimonadota bacterium]